MTIRSHHLYTFARRVGYGVGATAVGVPCLSFAYAGYVYATTPSHEISKSHTPYSIWVQSLTNLFMRQLGAWSASRLDDSCNDAAAINEQLLLSLCDNNKNTSYGKDYNLSAIKTREDFLRQHPITDHEHYNQYIARVCNGEDNVMFAGSPRMIGETSGTSGTRKLLPVNPLQRKVFFTEGIGVTFHALMQGVKLKREKNNVPISWPNLQKSTKLMYPPKYTTSDGGLRVGPNSSSPGDNKALLQLYTTPEDAWQIQNEEDMLFVHCLCALLDPNIGFIESNFASGVFNMFVCIQDNWSMLVESIQTGKLPTDFNIDVTLRKKLESKLSPNPERANELEAIRSNHASARGKGASFARLIWPSLHTILAVETGSFAIYGEKLRNEFIGDDITIYSPLYAATEGLIGVNPDIDGKTYILNPKSMFFEFLPVNDASLTNADTETTSSLFIEQLEVGKAYEVIITNLTGLYRYRFGDVVRCVDYKGQAPIVEVAYRMGQFLNALGERTSEEAMASALSTAASDDWKLGLKDYTCVEYFNRPAGKRRPKYTVYVELTDGDGNGVDRTLSRKEVEALDKRLGDGNELYAFFRRKKRLYCVQVISVREGTFQRIRKAMVDSGIGPTQIKQPRVTRSQHLVQILEDGAVPS